MSEILEPIKGNSKYTRKYGDLHKGKYPVYSASSTDPLTFLDTFDYEGEYLSWSTNGLAGTVRVLTGRFSVNGDRGLLIPKTTNLNIQYLKHVLEPVFRQLAKGRKGDKGEDEFTKLYPSMIGNIAVPLPVNADGVISVTEQHNIASRYDFIDKIKSEIAQKRERIRTIGVGIDSSEYSMKYVTVGELFRIERGSGKYTKTYTQKHLGHYPLYSGNTFGEFAFIDSCDYDIPCLTWAIDGLAGYMMVHKAPFSATNHRGVLIPKTADIDLDYIKFVLEPLFRQAKKGRFGDNGENEYTTLPPFMLQNIRVGIPVDESGRFSIDLQREIAAVYLSVEQYRHEIMDKLDTLLKHKIKF